MSVEKSSKGESKPMQSVTEMSSLVRLAAQPTVPGEGRARMIERAARRLGFTYRRAKAFVYEEAKRVEADEWRTARQQARDIIAKLDSRIEALRRIDGTFYQHEIAHLEQQLARVRHLVEG